MRKFILWSLVTLLFFSSCTEDLTKNVRNNTDSVCGDGVASKEELCDHTSFNVKTHCAFYGYETGKVKCTSTCELDFTDCKKSDQMDLPVDNPPVNPPIVDPKPSTPVCGNNIKEQGEDCDTQYSVGSCSQYGDFNKGDVFCTSVCTLNFSNCLKEVDPEPVCGNGIREQGEECDDGNMDNSDMCTNNCTVRRCGDDILAQDEQCDGNHFSITSCSELNPNYDTGFLKCSSTCSIDTSSCSISPKCGDGVVNSPTEQCDGSVDSHTCGDVYDQYTGTVVCNDCKLDYTGCVEVCPTNREFRVGKYTNDSTTLHILSDNGYKYIVIDNKIGRVIDSTTVQWVYSSVGDEGYYSYFEVGDCDCNSCNISFDNTSYLYRDEVNSATSKTMMYDYPKITQLPTYTVSSIDFPESVRTEGEYYSCNYNKCDDKDTYYYNITPEEFIISTGTKDSKTSFSLIKDLGDNIYLVRYNNGYKPDGVGEKPYAVIQIRETLRYRVCDNFNVKDKVVTILSWSQYRDTAIGTADFTSQESYIYKYPVKYSKNSCDDTSITPHLADIFLTDKDNIGKNLYVVSLNTGYQIYYNYCIDREPYLWYYTKDLMSNNPEDDTYPGYISVYRDNVLVFDGDYITKTLANTHINSPSTNDYPTYTQVFDVENYGRYQLEIIFPNKYFMEEYLKVDGDKQDIGLIPSFKQNSNTGYARDVLNNPIGLEKETIVICKVNLDDESRECKDTVLSFSIKAQTHYNFSDPTYRVTFVYGTVCRR